MTFSTVPLSQYGCRQKGRQFLDEEAKLSEEDEGADVSSDEEDGDELNHSLEGFVVNNTHCSQGLNGTMVFLCDFNVIIKCLFVLFTRWPPACSQTQRCTVFT